MNHDEWRARIATRYAEAVERGEHDAECEYHPEGFYLCHCKKRARIALGFIEPPSGELYFPPPSCLRCDGDLDYDEGWTCHACGLHWTAEGTDAEYQDEYGDDLAARSAEWAARWLSTRSTDPGMTVADPLCPPLPPGEDETCTHTPTCPTQPTDRES